MSKPQDFVFLQKTRDELLKLDFCLTRSRKDQSPNPKGARAINAPLPDDPEDKIAINPMTANEIETKYAIKVGLNSIELFIRPDVFCNLCVQKFVPPPTSGSHEILNANSSSKLSRSRISRLSWNNENKLLRMPMSRKINKA